MLKIFYLKIKIHGQLININEVTDFHNGFSTIFSALRSNTRWTIELMNFDICVEIIDDFMGFFNNILLEEFVDYSLIFMRSWYSVGFSNVFVQIDDIMTDSAMP